MTSVLEGFNLIVISIKYFNRLYFILMLTQVGGFLLRVIKMSSGVNSIDKKYLIDVQASDNTDFYTHYP